VAERYSFSVAYEPATMKLAVRAYIWRGLTYEHTWISTAAMTVLTIAIAFLVFAHDFDFMTGLFAGLVAALVVLIVLAGWLQWRSMQDKLARMKEPHAVFVLSDEAVEVKTDQGSGRFPWDAIRQIWKFKRVWLLMMDINRFVTLPLADAPAEALRFLDQKVRPRSFRD
jgi:hypothetical protein